MVTVHTKASLTTISLNDFVDIVSGKTKLRTRLTSDLATPTVKQSCLRIVQLLLTLQKLGYLKVLLTLRPALDCFPLRGILGGVGKRAYEYMLYK